MKMRSKILPLLLWGLSIACIVLALKASNEPILEMLSDTWVDSFFQQFTTGNSIIYNLSIGFLVSIFFYLLVVWYPKKQYRNLIKHNYQEHYIIFKKDMIWTFLKTIGSTSYNPDLLLKLTDVKEFRDYFNQPFRDSQNRWDGVLNELNEYHLKEILVGMEIFMTETAYVLNHLEINDPEVFAFLKRLSHAVYTLKDSNLGYDEIKPLSHFIWELFGGFSIVDGCRDYDIVQNMIKKI